MRLLRLIAFAATASWATAATFVWSGAAGDGVFDNPANWSGGVAPSSDGTAVVVFGNSGAGTIRFSKPADLAQIKLVNSGANTYVFTGASGAGLTLQGGIDAAGASGATLFGSGLTVTLAQDQNFVLGSGTVEVDGTIRGGGAVTQTGAGNLKLFGTNLGWTGGVTTASGTLTIAGVAPVGTGTLHLAGGTVALPPDSNAVVANPVVISASTALVGSQANYALFLGTVTLTDSVTLNVSGAQGFAFTGPITESGGPRQLVVTGLSPVVLSGSSNYTGGTRVENGSLIFGTAAAVPKTGAISASPLGYVGAGFSENLQGSLLDRLGGASFSGIIGFDTLPGLSPHEFHDQVDLTDLPNYHSLASHSMATLTGMVKVENGGDYRFGGGGGTLNVESNLTARGENLQLISPFGQALTLVLRGNNTYKGDTNVLNSLLILDRTNTLPQKSELNLLGPGYVGMTENAGLTPGAFLGRIDHIASPEAIVGLDSTGPGRGLTIMAPIDLSLGGARGDPYYLGTSTGATIRGAITPTTGDALYVTALKNSRLILDTELGANIPGLVVGQTNPFYGAGGTVELTRANAYTGGTQLRGGTLQVSNSNALGLAGVSVANGANLSIGSNVNVANAISLASGARLSGYGTLSNPGGTTIGPGAVLSPGGTGQIGRITFNTTLTFASGGYLELEVFKGNSLNTDFVSVTNGGLRIEAGSASPFTILLSSLGANSSGSSFNNFDLTKSFSFQFLGANSIEGFDPSEFYVDTTNFLSGINAGDFVVSKSGNSLMINFTPVPEPETLALFGLGALLVLVLELRRGRR